MQKISGHHDTLTLKDKLFRLALRITFNRAEAEDIVQETLIKVWNKQAEWDDIISIEAYCLTLTRNLAIDKSQKISSHHRLISTIGKRDVSPFRTLSSGQCLPSLLQDGEPRDCPPPAFMFNTLAAFVKGGF